MAEIQVQYEASLSETGEDTPPRLFLWVRRFYGGEELTGRYEVFDDLARLDGFIARATASGEDTTVLQEARERFAESLRRSSAP